MLGVRLYLAQRITAMVMAPFVFVHLAVMIYAIQGGLSAAEILSRTQGSLLWAVFYGTFVVAVSIHAAIGLRVIIHEYMGIRDGFLTLLTVAAMAVFLGMGARAVYAVVA